MKVKINNKVIEYINENRNRFEFDSIRENEIWDIDYVTSFPNVNNGEPVVNLSREEDGAFMKIPEDLIRISDIIGIDYI